MSSTDGKALERLVALIEGILLPDNVTIESRKNVFNDDRVQVAEFDILITGKFGSRPIKGLIECRDRPGDGAAPGSWIEQMIGRRYAHKFDMVMAVSTTGFSPGAIAVAKAGNIELRTVESLTRW